MLIGVTTGPNSLVFSTLSVGEESPGKPPEEGKMIFVLHKPRGGSIQTSQMTFDYYCLSIHGNSCAWGRSTAIIKHLVKIWINPWEGVMQDSDIWSVIWIGYIFLLQ